MSGYFASFTEWLKRFELVTCEDGCRVSLISGDDLGRTYRLIIIRPKLKTATKNSPISDQVNPPVHALNSKVPTTGIGIVERLHKLEIICGCKACIPGSLFQQLGDMRRTLIRGLNFLPTGADPIGQRLKSTSPIIFAELLMNLAESGMYDRTLLHLSLVPSQRLLGT
jgi:hypothetical protein